MKPEDIEKENEYLKDVNKKLLIQLEEKEKLISVLLRIKNESNNAAINRRPKRKNPYYVLRQSADAFAAYNTTFVTPYLSDTNLDDVQPLILQDLAVYVLPFIGADKVDRIKRYRNTKLVTELKSKPQNIVFNYKIHSDIHSDYWHITLQHSKGFDVPDELKLESNQYFDWHKRGSRKGTQGSKEN